MSSFSVVSFKHVLRTFTKKNINSTFLQTKQLLKFLLTSKNVSEILLWNCFFNRSRHPTYWNCHFEFFNFNERFVISDIKKTQLPTSVWIETEEVVRQNESIIFPTGNVKCISNINSIQNRLTKFRWNIRTSTQNKLKKILKQSNNSLKNAYGYFSNSLYTLYTNLQWAKRHSLSIPFDKYFNLFESIWLIHWG